MFKSLRLPLINHLNELSLLFASLTCLVWAHNTLPAIADTLYGGTTAYEAVTTVNLQNTIEKKPMGVIGARVNFSNGELLDVFPESDLYKAGIRARDNILQVNGKNIYELSPDQ